MSDHHIIEAAEEYIFNHKHRFLIFILSSLLISVAVVSISMFMYNSSGAAQLDLSRPGYQSVRSKAVVNDGDFHNFSKNGSLKKADLDYFKSQFEKQTSKVQVVDAFGSDPLNPSTFFGIDIISD
ncbi:hypothetical protein HGB25_02210 [Candidatus Saccharibacteria bacterium]|nr:hypothetical protein [Candidatus Saccharibacteria bacterium]